MEHTRTISTSVTSSTIDLALSAWLQKHGKRVEPKAIHHTRTSKAYEGTLTRFRAGLQSQGLDLGSDPG